MRSRLFAGLLSVGDRAAGGLRACGALTVALLVALAAVAPAGAEIIAGASDDGFNGFDSNGAPMAHPDIAVGPNHLVAVVNGEIAVFSKGGALLSSQPLGGAGGLWQSVGGTSAITDPSVIFDPRSGRYFAAAVENAPGARFICVAISRFGDPLQGWFTRRVPASSFGSSCARASVASDESAFLVVFEIAGGSYPNAMIWFERGAAVAGDFNREAYWFLSSNDTRYAPVHSFDSNAPTLAIGALSTVADKIKIQALIGPLGSQAAASRVFVGTVALNPPDAVQPGGSTPIDTGTKRITSATLRDGSIWAAHAVLLQDRSVVRWYEIRLNDWTTSGQSPSLRQTGVIDMGPGAHAWLPDIAVDSAGNAVIIFQTASPTQHVSIARAVRHHADALNTFRAPVLLRSGLTADPDGLWDSIVGVEPDPSEEGAFWSHAPYRTSDWQTWISKTVIEPDASDPNIDLHSPGDGYIYTIDIALLWSFAYLPEDFAVEVAEIFNFADAIYRADHLQGTSHTIPDGILECNKRYYWRVIAHTPDGDVMPNPAYRWFERPFPEDVNRDGIVNAADIGLLLSAYGGSGSGVSDVNADGVVNTADLGLMLSRFGQTCD